MAHLKGDQCDDDDPGRLEHITRRSRSDPNRRLSAPISVIETAELRLEHLLAVVQQDVPDRSQSLLDGLHSRRCQRGDRSRFGPKAAGKRIADGEIGQSGEQSCPCGRRGDGGEKPDNRERHRRGGHSLHQGQHDLVNQHLHLVDCSENHGGIAIHIEAVGLAQHSGEDGRSDLVTQRVGKAVGHAMDEQPRQGGKPDCPGKEDGRAQGELSFIRAPGDGQEQAVSWKMHGAGRVRDQRDEGYEAAPVGRAQIARADEPFVGAHRYS